jgi:hypothetical protein
MLTSQLVQRLRLFYRSKAIFVGLLPLSDEPSEWLHVYCRWVISREYLSMISCDFLTMEERNTWQLEPLSGELLSPLSVRRLSSVRPLTFHILINSSEATGPIWTKLWWNGPWMAPFQNCVRWSRLPTKMAAKLKIEKRGDEILIVHCCFSISQNELKF